MIIKNEKEYKKFENRMEALIQHGTELGDMDLLSEKEKEEFMMLSEALNEYGSAYHPLSGQMSSLLTDAILTQVKEKGLKQKEAAQMIGISPTFFSDLLHGRRTLSFEVARTIHKVLGIPAEVVLA
jgi:HTH-type transcriptional regulator/antitoxin HigA